jgi:hypothetical protein
MAKPYPRPWYSIPSQTQGGSLGKANPQLFSEDDGGTDMKTVVVRNIVGTEVDVVKRLRTRGLGTLAKAGLVYPESD